MDIADEWNDNDDNSEYIENEGEEVLWVGILAVENWTDSAIPPT